MQLSLIKLQAMMGLSSTKLQAIMQLSPIKLKAMLQWSPKIFASLDATVKSKTSRNDAIVNN